MTATLSVTREGFGIELRRGTFDVVLDGRDVATVEAHQTADAALEPGEHTIQIRAGRYCSPARTFEAAEGEVVAFRCHGANIWPRYVASIVKPDLAIALKRV